MGALKPATIEKRRRASAELDRIFENSARYVWLTSGYSADQVRQFVLTGTRPPPARQSSVIAHMSITFMSKPEIDNMIDLERLK